MSHENNASHSQEVFENGGINNTEEADNYITEEEAIKMKQITSFCMQFKNWTMSDTHESIFRKSLNISDTTEKVGDEEKCKQIFNSCIDDRIIFEPSYFDTKISILNGLYLIQSEYGLLYHLILRQHDCHVCRNLNKIMI